jgi:hypothetical protein
MDFQVLTMLLAQSDACKQLIAAQQADCCQSAACLHLCLRLSPAYFGAHPSAATSTEQAIARQQLSVYKERASDCLTVWLSINLQAAWCYCCLAGSQA